MTELTELKFKYDETELGYVAYEEDEAGQKTDKILLSGSIFLEVQLKSTGRVCIKKGNTEDGEFPKVEMTPITGPDFEFTITGDADGKYIQVITSAEPNYIRYENI